MRRAPLAQHIAQDIREVEHEFEPTVRITQDVGIFFAWVAGPNTRSAIRHWEVTAKGPKGRHLQRRAEVPPIETD